MERTFLEIQILEARQILTDVMIAMKASSCISINQYRRVKRELAVLNDKLIEERIRKQIIA